MVPEAELTQVPSGLLPASQGWFVLNLRDAAWFTHGVFGADCAFEGKVEFDELGIQIKVLEPGQPNGLYHREATQEDFLVLAGECLLLVEGEERRLGAWDFFHCAPDTEHIFVGAGDGPCVILMVGTRRPGRPIHYPISELAQRYGAGVDVATDSPKEAYSDIPDGRVERPPYWDSLPWA